MAAIFRFPFAFPPRGLVLGLFAALYLLPGLTGHDPWKTDDALHIAAVQFMLRDGHWLAPHLPGVSAPTLPPLYVWLGALFGKTLGAFFPLHDAIRLASGAAGGLLFFLLGKASAELHGKESGPVAILIAMGCLGLLTHLHEAQPTILLLAGMAASLWGLTLLPRRSMAGALILAMGISVAFLSIGLYGLLLTAPLALLPLVLSPWRQPPILRGALFGLALGLALCLLWPLAMAWRNPGALAHWWSQELLSLSHRAKLPWSNLGDYLKILAWFSWPALPLSLWVLWRQRRRLFQPPVALPFLTFLLALTLASLGPEVRNVTALTLLPALILLAAPGAGSLRRGAANALDWFGMMTFSLLILLVWIGWLAMVAGVPSQIAANAGRLLPGFSLAIKPLALTAAAGLSLAWFWLIFASPRRSPWRGTTHWAAGVITVWAVLMALWLPAIDFGKSYRPMAEDLARHLPGNGGCIVRQQLGTAQIASLYYFSGMVTVPEGSEDAASCRLLLVQTGDRDTTLPPDPGWKKLWEGRRASDRHEQFRLYQYQGLSSAEGRHRLTESRNSPLDAAMPAQSPVTAPLSPSNPAVP